MGALHLITGNEDYSVKSRAIEFIHSLCGERPEDHPALEIIRGDTEGEKAAAVLDKVLDTIETPSFLAPEKIVWLKHFAKFEEALNEPSTKKKPSRLDRLSDFLKAGLPADLTLIIDGTGLDRRKAFFKLCEKVCETSGGKLEWFEKTDPRAKGAAAILIRRLRAQALNAGKRLDEDAAAYLAETIGGDAARLQNEVDKLIAFAGDESAITLNDCFEIASRSTATLSWEFSGALAARNAAKALSLIPGIVETLAQERSGSSSAPELAIIASAAAEFKRLLMVRCEGEKFKIPPTAGCNAFYTLFDEQRANPSGSPLFSLNPFRVYKIWENAIRFSPADFAGAFRELFRANQAMVTGADPRLTLELLVVRIAGGPA